MISDWTLDHLSALCSTSDGGRYEIATELGRGGMGVVYLARDTVLNRDVALKVLHPTSEDQSIVAALEREARILARLEHPGVVPIHDVGRLPDGRIFYTMKCIRGERLDRWAARGQELTARLGVVLRISDAVAFAHAQGIIHCDLKPENVMVGEFGEVLVLDWGVAAAKGDRPPRTAIAGTPDYMAPEQLMPSQPIDERADVYALGGVLATIANEKPALLAIACKARSADPAARYQSVQAMAADVSRYLAGLAVEAHPEPFTERAARIIRRHRVAIVLVLTYLVVRVLLLWAVRI
jgi:predicted Ser/Thr protein kinase